MVNIRLRSIIRKEFIQIIRDPRTLILVIAIPIMQLLMMGYAATTDVRNVPLAIFDQDRGPEARALLDAYRAADYFRLAYDVDSLDEILSLIDRGDAKAGLIIPPDYNQQMAKEVLGVVIVAPPSESAVVYAANPRRATVGILDETTALSLG
ncbi:MAG TPA: ABC transporter permease, partial [Anaerolineales bacterium]|nr:ABC transporter permease [Anaerolineales bacterium]